MPRRDRFLRAVTAGGVALWLITELLSAGALLERGPLMAAWLVCAAAAVCVARRWWRSASPVRFDAWVLAGWLSIAGILALTGITAAFSAPNSADAMAYHLPRVVYWAEQGSVRFFPTPYLNQIMLQPLAEYAMLHLYLLAGGDWLTNFVQWCAAGAAIVAVSAVAGELGFAARGQTVAALFCATLPAGILASSGAKNDYLLALWLVTAVYSALRYSASGRRRDALLLGAALGCALLTKATAYLFAPWPLAAVFLARRKVPWLALAVALLLNAPHYARNRQLSGSPLGFDSAQADGVYRWRNETFGWKQTASNAVRHLSEQLGARSERWNQSVYRAALWMHERLGVSPGDPATTWPGSHFAPPQDANHEANAPNRRHLAVLLLACVFAWRAGRLRALYALALVVGFAAFCAYLKWQPFAARMLLPLFVLAAPLAGFAAEGRKRAAAVFTLAMCVWLVAGARLPLLENWTRPLRGPRSVFHTPREAQYFTDMTQWHNAPAYHEAAQILSHTNCATIGIDSTNLQLEYPLMVLVRARRPASVFVHTGVTNPSARYRPPVDAQPCAVVCLDCLEDTARRALYSGFTHIEAAGQFVVYDRM
jgi:hypothetical protein